MYAQYNTVGANTSATKFFLKDENEIIQHLKDLHHNESPTNWILLGYQGSNAVSFIEKGTGGLEEFKSKLVPDQVQYGVLELLIQGDEYNPIKFVLVTWIGPKVSAGLGKARASAHRDELFDFIKKGLAISAQHQAESLHDLSYDQLAQAISRYRPTYGTSAPATGQRQNMSRATATKGTLSTFAMVDRAACDTALKTVHEGSSDWAILAYVVGKKDEVELVKTGTGGIEGLKKEFPSDRIFYALVRVQFKTSAGDVLKKFVLVTMVGSEVPPLQKARSSAQRKDIADFIISAVPLNGNLQPNDPSELSEQIILKMFSE